MTRRGGRGGESPRPGARAPTTGPGLLARLDLALAGSGTGIALAIVALWTLVVGAVCVGKWRAFLYDDFDLALFAQAIHGVMHGSFASSIRGMPWLADHSSLILVPLAPLTWIVPAPLLLLGLQTAALGGAALVVHRLARRELASPLAALALAATWLLQPALGYVALFEFHPETLAVPALLVVWDAWREGRRTRMVVAAVVALLAKEDVALVILGLALTIVLARRRRGLADAVALALPALAVTLVSFLVLKPLAHGLVDYGRLYARWGASPGAAMMDMLAHPIRVVTSLFQTSGDAADTAAKRMLWVQWLTPWLAAPLVAPLVWPAVAPIVLEHLLSDRIEQHVIVYQYSTLVMPWLACGTVTTLTWFGARTGAPGRGRPRVAAGGALLVLVAVAFAAWWWGPFTAAPGALPVRPPQRLVADGGDRAMRPWREHALARLAGREGLVSGFETLSHLYDRRALYSAHHVLGGVYTFSDIPYPLPHGVTGAVLDTGTEMALDWIDSDSPHRWQTLVSAEHLAPVEAHGDLTLWLAGVPDTLALVRPGPVVGALEPPISYEDRIRLLGVAWPPAAVPAGGEVPMTFSWQRHGDIEDVIELGLALERVDGETEKQAVHSRLLGYGLWSVDDWGDDVVMCERYRYVLPDDLAPGRYRVMIAAANRSADGLRPLAASRPPDRDGFLTLGEVTVTSRVASR